ncbi:MAG: LTA synthase family protein [Alphaproteobacteria bacterium]|nr:LTA synthase family protein [Alphaproteobacteria bacterium]
MATAIIIVVLLGCGLLADRLVRPRAPRTLAGQWLALLLLLALFGLVTALAGNLIVAALFTAGLAAALALVSNVKRGVLGEALLFTDLVLAGAVFRHPQFYLSALKRWQLAALVLGAAGLGLGLALALDPQPQPHLAGAGLLAMAILLLRVSLQLPPWRRLAPVPDADADVAAHGLLATLLLHWWRWRASPDPPPCHAGLPAPASAALVIAVQCESFADPADLFGDPALALPGLKAARDQAWAHGGLLVSGFGAYTMRTEYGLIFGRDEAELGFRRFDPYLTAAAEGSGALPARLARAGWTSLFIHPHDLGFYGRDRILPAAGFAELLGPDAFAPPAGGRYVADAAIAGLILARAANATGPCFIHAVTIENHGPWPVDQAGSQGRLSGAYLDLVGRGDAMLAQLMAGVAALGRPAVLLFYGDHRPSIPGVVMPGGDRLTPYVLLRFGADGRPIPGCGTAQDRTPAELHRALIAAITA